jgi:hypothetical protein
MGTSPRKDYAAGAVIAPGNKTMKRVNSMNAPASMQATGHDKHPDKHIEITSDNLDSLATGTRVLVGNDEGRIKTVNNHIDGYLEDILVSYSILDSKETRDVGYTKQEILDTSVFFLVTP